jgi:acetylornithine deacetylase
MTNAIESTFVAVPMVSVHTVAAPTLEADLAADAAVEGATAAEMLEFFRSALSFPSVSGNEREFVHFVAGWGRRQGFQVDLWQADEASLGVELATFLRHLPLTGRPTLVLELPGDPTLPSILFNAHSDVVSADVEAWTHNPWTGTLANGRMYGRGACDTKGPLVSALWAMTRLSRQPARRGSVLLELVPGEEDCVGLGTFTSVMRDWHADAVIVLEPTDQLPRCASRGGCRFEIEILGRSVHGTVKWLGRDAIAGASAAMAVLAELEGEFNLANADELFAGYPVLRPITVDSMHGGQWQGMVCDRCVCAGYLELLPADDLDAWRRRFASEVISRLQTRGVPPDEVRIQFLEEYRGHRLEPSHAMCRCAADAVAACATSEPFCWAGFNSGCEAGLRANRTQTPTLVWGPGSLAQAHAVDEYVEWADVRRVADMFTRFIHHWSDQ